MPDDVLFAKMEILAQGICFDLVKLSLTMAEIKLGLVISSWPEEKIVKHPLSQEETLKRAWQGIQPSEFEGEKYPLTGEILNDIIVEQLWTQASLNYQPRRK